MTRLCVFAHYDKDNLIDEYVLYFLHQLKTVVKSIVFVSTSKIGKEEIIKLEKLCDKVILRENQGFDFVSWQIGIKDVTNLNDFDEMILCNDSIYGPLYPLADIFNTMSFRDGDFWGMTDSYDVAYHLQSYFLVFKKNTFNSESFKRFWNEIKSENSKRETIVKYEIGLTQYLLSQGFKPYTFVPSSLFTLKILKTKAGFILRNPFKAIRVVLFTFKKQVLNYKALNPTHYLWKDLFVKYKMPFIKIELLRDNPSRVNIKDYKKIVRKYSKYNIDLIEKHLSRLILR